MSCNSCGSPVAAGCVKPDSRPAYAHLTGENLQEMLRVLDDELGVLFGRTATTNLVRRNLTPAEVENLPSLLQALINRVSTSNSSAATVTTEDLLATPLGLHLGCLAGTCPGETGGTLGAVLTGLVSKVCQLQTELAQLRATSTTFYVP